MATVSLQAKEYYSMEIGNRKQLATITYSSYLSPPPPSLSPIILYPVTWCAFGGDGRRQP